MNTIAALLSSPAADRVGWTIIHSCWEFPAVAILYALLASIAPISRTASRRYLAGCAALFVMFLCPAVTWVVVPRDSGLGITEARVPGGPAGVSVRTASELQQPVPSTRPAAATGDLEFDAEPIGAADIGLPERRASIFARLSPAEALRPALPWLCACWMVGVWLMSVWHVGGWVQIQRLKRRAQQASIPLGRTVDALALRIGVRRRVLVLESGRIRVPCVVGWLRPAILLPAGLLLEMPPEQVELLLLHELAHIRRHDYAVNLLQGVAETLFFYHPAVWWVSRCIRREREHCADEMAVAACGDRFAYAKALTRAADFARRPPALAVASTGGSLTRRIVRILEPGRREPRGAQGWLAGAGVATLSIGTVLVVCIANASSGEGTEKVQTAPALESGARTATQPATPDEEPRAWNLLRQTDTTALLHGLPSRLGRVVESTPPEDPKWTGDKKNAGSVVIDLQVDEVGGKPAAGSEILVGLFADPRWWIADPVQVRRFPGPGRYTIDSLPAGRLYLGAMMGKLPEADALGVHSTWPDPIEIRTGETPETRVLVSPMFRANPFNVANTEMMKGFAGQWGQLKPDHLVTVGTVDHNGRPAPFCRVTFATRRKKDINAVDEYIDRGTDENGLCYIDTIEGAFSLMAQRFDVVPRTMVQRYQFLRPETIYQASNRPTITIRWDPFPSGLCTVSGAVTDDGGNAIRGYYLNVLSETGERGSMDNFSSFVSRVPVSSEDGRYKFAGLPVGKYRIGFRAFDYAAYDWWFAERGQEFVVSEDEKPAARVDLEVRRKRKERGAGGLIGGKPHDPSEPLPALTKQHGPWMVLVQRYEVDIALEEQMLTATAESLVRELRSNGIPAWVHHAPRGPRPEENPHRKTIIVLAGNYDSREDEVAQRTLKYIREFTPEGATAPGRFQRADFVRTPLLPAIQPLAANSAKGGGNSEEKRVTVRGSVRLKDSGEPIGGITVSCTSISDGWRGGGAIFRAGQSVTAKTDEQGRFELQLPSGQYTLTVRPDVRQEVDERRVRDHLHWGRRREFEITGEEKETINLSPIEAVPTRPVQTTIVDERGEPIGEASVSVTHNGGWFFGINPTGARTNADGELPLELAALDLREYQRELAWWVDHGNHSFPATVLQFEPLVLQGQRDRRWIKGIWNVVASRDARRAPWFDPFKNPLLLLNENRFMTIQNGKQESSGSYKIDPAKRPGEITLMEPGREAVPGIYQFDGETLWIRLNDGGQTRPGDLTSEPGDNDVLLKLERVDLEKSIATVPGGGKRENARAQTTLTQLVDAEFIDTPLTDAVAFLSDFFAIGITIDEATLKRANIDEYAPIDLIVDDTPLHATLTWMLTPLELTYKLDGGKIVIVPRDAAAE